MHWRRNEPWEGEVTTDVQYHHRDVVLGYERSCV